MKMTQLHTPTPIVVVALALALVAAGCSSDLSHFESGAVEGRVPDSSLVISNKGPDPIYYFAIERGAAAFTLWVPESGDDNKIGARKTRAIALADIHAYKKGKEILFYYWTSQDPGPGDVRSLVIDTP